MEANLARRRTSARQSREKQTCVCVRACASAFQLFNKRPPLFCDFKRAGPLATLQSQTQTERLKGPIVDTRADFFKLSSKNSTENYCWVNIVLLLVFFLSQAAEVSFPNSVLEWWRQTLTQGRVSYEKSPPHLTFLSWLMPHSCHRCFTVTANLQVQTWAWTSVR